MTIDTPSGRLGLRSRALFGLATALERMHLVPPPARAVLRPPAKRRGGAVPGWLAGKRPAGVRIDDRVIESPAGPLPLRVYAPADAAGPLPGLLWFHGGGWTMGSVLSTDVLCAELAVRAGVRVVSVDYRLSPETPFPGALDDGATALAWVVAQAGSLGIDATLLGVGGDSAGGNLAAALALRARAEGLPAFACQLLVYPALDATLAGASMRSYRGPGLRREAMAVYWASYAGGHDPRDPLLSPAHAASLAGLPPAVVVTVGFDCLTSEGAEYAEALRAAGVAAEHQHYPDAPHGFLSLGGVCPDAAAAVPALAASLRRLVAEARAAA